MATVLNRTTKVLIASADTAEYPIAEWIINPDMLAVAGQPSRYWTIAGDAVSLMSAGEQTAVDTALLNASRDAMALRIDQIEDYDRAFALAILDELNLHATRITAILTAIDGAATLAALKTSVLAIADVPQRTVAQIKTTLRSKLGS